MPSYDGIGLECYHVESYVVGYAVEAVAQEQWPCITQATGGIHHKAEGVTGLLQTLEEAMAATAPVFSRLEQV
jgi:hypothetical protein